MAKKIKDYKINETIKIFMERYMTKKEKEKMLNTTIKHIEENEYEWREDYLMELDMENNEIVCYGATVPLEGFRNVSFDTVREKVEETDHEFWN